MTAQALDCDLKVIKLVGRLGQRFGYEHRLAVESPAEALRAMCAMFKGFREYLRRPGSEYHFLTGRKSRNKDELTLPSNQEYILAPATRGSKKGGFLQVIVGAVLTVVGFVTGNAVLVKAGLSLVLGGVAQMLAPSPKSNPNEKDKNKPNSQFNGAVNTTAQGHNVPLAYGEIMAGSAVISAGLTSGFLSAESEIIVPGSGGAPDTTAPGSGTTDSGWSYGGGTGISDTYELK